jgi:hypothetical protein
VSSSSALGALVDDLFSAPGAGGSFLQEIKSRLVPGTSSLLVLSSDADLDTVRQFVERGVCHGDVSLMAAWLPNVAADGLTALLGVDLEHHGMIARSG